jgi:ATP-dependent protease HslVU (ClpYQ) peptidase subunit
MTTIIYSKKEKLIAFDSRQSAGNLIISDDCNKSLSRSGVTFVISGYPCDFNIIIDSYFSEDNVIDDRINFSALALDHSVKKVYLLTRSESRLMITPLDTSISVGSGEDFALAALDFGRTAKEAVKYAMTRDSGTGGKIRSVKL